MQNDTPEFWKETLQLLITNNFNFDSSINVYEQIAIHNNFTNLPLLFRVHVNTPERFGNFLHLALSTLSNVQNPDMPLYRGANIFTVLCCGVFHLCKLRKIYKPDETPMQIAEWYLKPFSIFIEGLFALPNLRLKFNQKIPGFCTPYTYLLMTSFCSRYMDFNDIPLVKLIDNADFKLDMLEEIVKPMLAPQDDECVKDIFGLDIRQTYENDRIVNNLIVDQYLFVNDSSLDTMIYMSLEQSAKNTRLTVIRNVYDYVKFVLTNHLSIQKFKLITYINIQTTDFLYDLHNITQSNAVLYNEKWQFLLDVIYELILKSNNLEGDLPDILINLFDDDTAVSYEYFINNRSKETILSVLLANQHFDVNSKYIKKIMKCVLNGNWSKMPFGDYLEAAFNADQILGYTNRNDDLLLSLLEKYFTKSNKRRRDMSSMRSLSRRKAIFDYEDHFSLGSPMSVDGQGLHKDMKIIIKSLIRFVVTKMNFQVYINDDLAIRAQQSDIRKRYFELLLKYKESLKTKAGIDLDTFGLDIPVVNSPPNSKSRRSVDLSLQKDEEYLDERAGKFRHFYNKKFMTKLAKLYKRHVNRIEDEECNVNRILNIQKYFIMRYRPNVDYINYQDYNDIFIINDVVRDRELDILYGFWQNALGFGNLNVKYYIGYAGEPGVNVYGLTKEFFSNVAAQIEEAYFDDIDYSDRKVLKARISVREAEFAGQCMALFLVYETRITFNLPIFYLGHMMFAQGLLTYEEMFLYFLLDLNEDKYFDMYTYGCADVVDYEAPQYKAEDDLCNPKTFVDHYCQEKYRFKDDTFKAFLKGFSSIIEKKIFLSKYRKINDKIRIYDMDKLLSQYKFSVAGCRRKIFDPIILTLDNSPLEKTSDEATVYRYLEELFLVDTDFSVYYQACQITDANKSEFESKENFCKAILMYWSGIYGLNTTNDYKVNIRTTIPVGQELLGSNICFNLLELPLKDKIESKQALYNYFMNIFVAGAHKISTKA